ncbi:putative quinol monooxygenase [Galbitalea sp. SE-J8]|uniref:putative quinol monooxygenase n=1 Tax=Galbitalea sp. SE-J8 TaxID=3054952 RepID=UPI00259D1A92|nr:putative quinol monooxygenase [Galbitalea sp. SE-J8]MDM4762031.1 putative quinol monooxygenase [Galbitalea sp. SE-J8]
MSRSRRVLYAEFTAADGIGDTVAALLAGFAERVRAEPGNVAFEPFRVEGATERFFVYEVYRDEAAFQEHITADYGAVFNAALEPLIVEDASQLTWLTAVPVPSPGEV